MSTPPHGTSWHAGDAHDPMRDEPLSRAVEAMLERCDAHGLMACVLSPTGRFLAHCAPQEAWRRVMASKAMHEAIHTRIHGALTSGRLAAGAGPKLLDDGLWLATFPIGDVDEGDLRPTLCVVLVGDDAERSQLLARVCEECNGPAGADAQGGAWATPQALVKTSSPIRPRAAVIIASLLKTMSEDAQAVQRCEADTAAFTKQLTNAFDTIELLYDLGRSMKAPFSPMDFLKSLCARTRATLRFGWLAVCFDVGAKTPPSLHGAVAHDGTLPIDPDRLLHALGPALKDRDTTCKIRTDLPGLCVGGGQVITQPMLCKGHQIGVLVAGGKHGDDPMVSSYDTQLAEACSGFLATFVENVHLYDEQRELFLGTLQALTAAIDAKDRYTCGHSERVALISQQLAHAAGLPPLACEDLRVAGLVHDVGKIGVPESVLLKAGKLTDEEYELVKRHPETGHRILAAVPLLANVLPGVLHHHERYDGHGYPHGLGGGDIPLMARIIAVADTFDAMSSDRSYRAKMPRHVVLAEIRRCAGSQLDPRLCELLQTLDFSSYDAMTRRHASEAAEHVSLVVRKVA